MVEFFELRIAVVAGLVDDLSALEVGVVVLVKLLKEVQAHEVGVGDVVVSVWGSGGQDQYVTLQDQTGGQHHVAPLFVCFDALVAFVAV